MTASKPPSIIFKLCDVFGKKYTYDYPCDTPEKITISSHYDHRTGLPGVRIGFQFIGEIPIRRVQTSLTRYALICRKTGRVHEIFAPHWEIGSHTTLQSIDHKLWREFALSASELRHAPSYPYRWRSLPVSEANHDILSNLFRKLTHNWLKSAIRKRHAC